MPTLPQIRDAVDAKLALLWATIQTREDTYAAAHGGRYWQGLLTNSTYPAEGIEVLPDIGTACPTDQLGVPWPVGIRTTPLPMALRIDCYDGEAGTGYQATVYVSVLGNIYSRTAQSGPETWRVQGWHQIQVDA